MTLPRDLSGGDVVKGLRRVGYSIVRQRGSHIRLTTNRNGQHHITVPNHDQLTVGTLGGILKSVAEHLGLDRDALLDEMFP